MKKIKYIVLSSDEIDKIIQEKLYKHIKHVNIKNYECVPYEEYNNYSCYDFQGITKEASKDNMYLEYDKPKLIEGKIIGLRSILLFLVEHDEIEEGDYLIRVYW